MTGFGKLIGAALIASGFAAGMATVALANDAAKPGIHRGITQDFSAQRRTRITVYPRRTRLGANAKRHCEATLVKEYRVSGPVIVPHQTCWWQ
jgi:hypothetical protein